MKEKMIPETKIIMVFEKEFLGISLMMLKSHFQYDVVVILSHL